jgi:hypothetical protein
MSLKEKLGLTENVYVGVGLDRRRVRPPPGTMIIEMVDRGGNTLMIDTVPTEKQAPRGPFHVLGRPATYVQIGATGYAHQAFAFFVDEPEYPVEIPQHLLDKIELGAQKVRVWWSCEGT